MVLPDCKYGATCYRKDSTHHASYRHPCKYGAACYRLDPAHRSVHSHPDTGAAASTGQQAGDSGTESASMDEGSSSAESEDEGVPPAASASAPLQQPAAAPAGGVKGKHVVFTGTYRCGKRSQVESLAATAGVVVGKGVTKNTDYLVVGALINPKGHKQDRAEELGTTILTEDEWDKMMVAAQSGGSAAPTAAAAAGAKRSASPDPSAGPSPKKAAVATGAGAGAALPTPKTILKDGESLDVKSQSSATLYTIKRTGDHYYCTCPAWRNQNAPVNGRTCKHLRLTLGDAYEKARVGGIQSMPLKPAGAAKPALLLAHKFEDAGVSPDGYWMSEKLDGVRCFWDGKALLSRNGNPFAAPSWFTDKLPKSKHLDGELFVGRGQFNATTSIVKTVGSSKWDKVKYHVFDTPNQSGLDFERRCEWLREWHDEVGNLAHVTIVEQTTCKGTKHMTDELEKVLALGGEGLMLRKPGSLYAHTRSMTLLKVKRFQDAEARVTGHQDGKGKHKGRVGALLCEMACGKKFKVGTGMSDHQREHPPKVGAIITYKFQELTPDGVPRFPVFVGERVDMDKPKDPS